MIGKVLPVLLALIGLGGGVGAGLLLRQSSNDTDHSATVAQADHASDGQADEHAASSGGHSEGTPEYVKMNNQFVIPVVKNGRVTSMVVLSLSLEVAPGNTEAVYQREPKLRDAFLQVLFDHANIGGFSGSFTDGSNLVVLRNTLREAAVLVMGGVVTNILITDIARQDV